MSGLDVISEYNAAKKKKIIMALAVVLMIVLLVAAGGYYFMASDESKAISNVIKTVDQGGEGEGENGDADSSGEGRPAVVFHYLPEILVDLNVSKDKKSYLKLALVLELTSQSDVATVNLYLPKIMDAIQVYLRELRLEDIKGSSGMYRVREELTVRINSILYPVAARDVLFGQLLLQ